MMKLHLLGNERRWLFSLLVFECNNSAILPVHPERLTSKIFNGTIHLIRLSQRVVDGDWIEIFTCFFIIVQRDVEEENTAYN